MTANPRATPAGNPIHMIRPHLRDIPVAAFPEGFTIRPLRIETEGQVWTDIVRESEEWLDLSAELFLDEFGHNLQAASERCFLIVDAADHTVGTISAWYRKAYRGRDYGLIHWVAVRPSHQGRGLGKAGLSFALNQLARWHDRALLGTQTRRLPAIALYLNFGFVPDLEEEGARRDWQRLKGQLIHPVFDGLDL